MLFKVHNHVSNWIYSQFQIIGYKVFKNGVAKFEFDA